MAEHGFVSDAGGVAEMTCAAEELKRIHATGRKTEATVLERRETGRRIGSVAVIELLFDVDDGGLTRRVRHEHLFGPRAARRYTPGRTSTVWIDPQDPGAICPGR